MQLPKWPNPNYFHHINLGLERVIELLKRLDNPHLKIPPTIHVAGTNGKGSTLAFLKHIYQDAGYKVHLYTSPHLVEFNERIELAGIKICDDFLQEILDECQKASEIFPKIDVTFFEATTVVAFLAFSKVPADIVLLETGMGGEYDATNVLPQILQSIITPISYDHQDFLGDTIAEIAKAKAGIIKKNCSVICAKQIDEAQQIIDSVALELRAPIIKTTDFCDNLKFDFQSLKIPLIGKHQIENCQTAITAVKNQNIFKINDDNIKRGIENTKWQARLEKINQGNFIKKLPPNFLLFLDGSHNIQGASTIKEFLTNNQNKSTIVIFQMLKDKNCLEFLDIIKDKIDKLFTFDISDNPKFRSAQEVLEICHKLSINCEIAENFDDIFNKIIAELSPSKNLPKNLNDKIIVNSEYLTKESSHDVLILICGSLYLAGKFLQENMKNL